MLSDSALLQLVFRNDHMPNLLCSSASYSFEKSSFFAMNTLSLIGGGFNFLNIASVLPVVGCLPVNVFKPRVFLDIFGVVLGTKSLLRVSLQQLYQQILQLLSYVFWQCQFLVLNIFKQSLFVEAVVGWHSFNKLVDHDTKEVPIQSETMSLPTN